MPGPASLIWLRSGALAGRRIATTEIEPTIIPSTVNSDRVAFAGDADMPLLRVSGDTRNIKGTESGRDVRHRHLPPADDEVARIAGSIARLHQHKSK